jgi:hypothetical protein
VRRGLKSHRKHTTKSESDKHNKDVKRTSSVDDGNTIETSLGSELVAHQINNDEGEITIVEDLASDTILFYGSTSTTTASAWRQSPRFAGGIMSISLSFEATPQKDDVLVDSPPCSPDLVLHLIGLYFTHVHPYFPMIDRHSFARQFKEKRTEHFALLLNSMCALMTQQSRGGFIPGIPGIPSNSGSGGVGGKSGGGAGGGAGVGGERDVWGVANAAELHNAFFERARILLGRQFDWPHINNVQAMLLLCMVGQGTNINASSYHYIGE